MISSDCDYFWILIFDRGTISKEIATAVKIAIKIWEKEIDRFLPFHVIKFSSRNGISNFHERNRKNQPDRGSAKVRRLIADYTRM